MIEKVTVEWGKEGRRFRFVIEAEQAELSTPEGQLLTLELSDWLKLSDVIRKNVRPKAAAGWLRQASDATPSFNAGAPWSSDQDNQLRARWLADPNIARIADEFGRTKGAVRSRLMRLGLLLPSSERE